MVRRNDEHLGEAERGARRFPGRQMAEVNRVEGAAENADAWFG
jgi:hypothetical protein